MKTYIIAIALYFTGLYGCTDQPQNGEDKSTTSTERKYELKFDADSAYKFVQDQVDFGPRVPGTRAHGLTLAYLTNKLADYCDTAFVQQGSIKSSSGRTAIIRNVIGSFNLELRKRVLLCAHYDTRPQADEDGERPTEPADGANDGASGVGVLLEVARQLSIQEPNMGVDIILFDEEDGGDRRGVAESWCLGSQYWAKTPHKKNYVARFGILLDMVGAKDAKFAIEGNSWNYAQPYVKKVWRTADQLGYGNYFSNSRGGTLIDDHLFINKIIGIPTLDIIQYEASGSGFGDFWHTHKDNMSGIDKNTLKAVGETVFKVVMDM